MEDPEVASLSFDERFSLLVDQHWTWRENQAMASRLKKSKLPAEPCVEDIDFRHPRGLDRSLIRTLADSRWVAQHHSILFTGPTGVGKSWLAQALAQKACRDGYTVWYRPIPKLFRELMVARADGSLGRVLETLARTDVLVVDDFAMAPLNEQERRDFLEICDDRYNRRSMILTSQLPVEKWHAQMGDPTVADSILDRLVHNAYRIELSGESIRKRKGRGGGEGGAGGGA
jgi:DNA replication protein DnaC